MKKFMGMLAMSITLGSCFGAVGHVVAAKPPCRTHSVYVRYGDPVPCDVAPPQRLHIVRTPSRGACDDMGGRWSANRICWDVDY